LQPKSHENGLNGEHDSQRGEKVWLVHRGGFCSAIKLNNSNDGVNIEPGKVLVELEHNGEQIYVDDDDVEKANVLELDLSEDICHLKHLNEASLLHCIRQRYASNLIHTRAGPTLIVVNPQAPLSLYSEKVRFSKAKMNFINFKNNIILDRGDVPWM
jgi:myosin XVIII